MASLKRCDWCRRDMDHKDEYYNLLALRADIRFNWVAEIMNGTAPKEQPAVSMDLCPGCYRKVRRLLAHKRDIPKRQNL